MDSRRIRGAFIPAGSPKPHIVRRYGCGYMCRDWYDINLAVGDGETPKDAYLAWAKQRKHVAGLLPASTPE